MIRFAAPMGKHYRVSSEKAWPAKREDGTPFWQNAKPRLRQSEINRRKNHA